MIVHCMVPEEGIREWQLVFSVWSRAKPRGLSLRLSVVMSREFRLMFAFIGENLGPRVH